jgi:hypothetical protein
MAMVVLIRILIMLEFGSLLSPIKDAKKKSKNLSIKPLDCSKEWKSIVVIIKTTENTNINRIYITLKKLLERLLSI